MNQFYNFEIYLIDPISKCTGWEIKNVSVLAKCKTTAKEKLKKFQNFDCIILYNFEHKENESCNFMFTENYPKFKIIERL